MALKFTGRIVRHVQLRIISFFTFSFKVEIPQISSPHFEGEPLWVGWLWVISRLPWNLWLCRYALTQVVVGPKLLPVGLIQQELWEVEQHTKCLVATQMTDPKIDAWNMLEYEWWLKNSCTPFWYPNLQFLSYTVIPHRFLLVVSFTFWTCFPFCLRSTQTPPSFFAGEVPSQLQQLREKLLQAVPALPAELQKQLQVVVREGSTKRSKEEKCQLNVFIQFHPKCRNFMKFKKKELRKALVLLQI